MARVLTVGVFDLLHYGHFELFRRAKELAGANGVLTVAVQEDAVVTKYKPDPRLGPGTENFVLCYKEHLRKMMKS